MSSDTTRTSDGEMPPMSPAGPARQVFSRRWWAVILGSLLALATVVAIGMLTSGRRLPTIDPQRFAAARELWQRTGPPNYDLEVEVTEIEPAVYRVAVRNGKVASATRNGAPLTQRRTLGVWSVPGMFSTIAIDLKHATDPIELGPRDVNYVTSQGVFDPQFGYPVRYRRIQWGSDNEASWVVTKFEVAN